MEESRQGPAEPRSPIVLRRDEIRWMIRRDMLEVLIIERECFPHPWVSADFVRCLRQRNCVGMVADYRERVRAFMVYELHKTRLHVLNFAVALDWQRRGIGRQMAEKLVGKLSRQRRTKITLEVSEDNTAAHLFWQRMGFRARLLRGHYATGGRDAYQFTYQVPRGRGAQR